MSGMCGPSTGKWKAQWLLQNNLGNTILFSNSTKEMMVCCFLVLKYFILNTRQRLLELERKDVTNHINSTPLV